MGASVVVGSPVVVVGASVVVVGGQGGGSRRSESAGLPEPDHQPDSHQSSGPEKGHHYDKSVRFARIAACARYSHAGEYNSPMRPVGRGDTGKRVVDIQTRLAALGYYLGNEGADGVFGPNTEKAIRAFQQGRLLCAGGMVEANTWTELVEAGYKPGERLLYLRVPYMRGDDVLSLQRRLDEMGFDCGPVDGIFSPSLGAGGH